MKAFLAMITLSIVSIPAYAAKTTTICGMNKPDGEKIRLVIVLDRQDAFVPSNVVTINGKTPARISADGAFGFGPHGYEHVTLKMTGDCEGTADYSHFNAKNPMNPMENLA